MNVEDVEFVDSNVFVYAYDASAGVKAEKARALIERLWQAGTGGLSVQVLQEFFTTVTRKIPRRLDPRRAAEIVEDLSRWRVHCPEPRDVLAAIDIHVSRRVSFWDALILRSALALAATVVWSEDLSPGPAHPRLKVRNPFA